MEIPENQNMIKIPHGNNVSVTKMRTSDGKIVDVGYSEYAQVESILGEFGVIPPNVFLDINMNIIEWLRNLILDYAR